LLCITFTGDTRIAFRAVSIEEILSGNIQVGMTKFKRVDMVHSLSSEGPRLAVLMEIPPKDIAWTESGSAKVPSDNRGCLLGTDLQGRSDCSLLDVLQGALWKAAPVSKTLNWVYFTVSLY
jgi:hypothetical protein